MSWLKRGRSDATPKPARPALLRGPFPAGPPGDQFDVFLEAAGERKINVIKVTRECTGYGLKEAKDLVDAAARGPVLLLTRLSRYDADQVRFAFTMAGAAVGVQPSAEAGGPVLTAGPAGPWQRLPAGEPGDQFDVVLTAAGENKIQVIKAIRQCVGYGLKEAKDLVDAAARGPAVLAAGLPLSDANRLASALTMAGAAVSVIVSPRGPLP